MVYSKRLLSFTSDNHNLAEQDELKRSLTFAFKSLGACKQNGTHRTSKHKRRNL